VARHNTVLRFLYVTSLPGKLMIFDIIMTYKVEGSSLNDLRKKHKIVIFL